MRNEERSLWAVPVLPGRWGVPGKWGVPGRWGVPCRWGVPVRWCVPGKWGVDLRGRCQQVQEGVWRGVLINNVKLEGGWNNFLKETHLFWR